MNSNKIVKNKIDSLNIVVISLFDGLSGGRLATDKVKHLNVLRYYSSEIDKYAIQVADKNYPQDTPYRLGDITKIDFYKLLQEIRTEFGNITILLLGGSPCQGFSMAGKLKGSSTACGVDVNSYSLYRVLKKRDFAFNGQSYLFWEFVRAMKTLKPDYFMLENVRVTKKWKPMFDEAMGVEPHRLNGSLVSAQNRDRYYWTNIQGITPPDDERKHLVIKDILEGGQICLEKNLLTKDTNKISFEQNFSKESQTFNRMKKNGRNGNEKGICLTASCFKGMASNGMTNVSTRERPCELREFKEDSVCHHTATATDIKGDESIKRVYAESGKSPAVTTCQGGHREPKVLLNKYESDEFIVHGSIKPGVAKNIIEQHKDIIKSEKDFFQMKCTSGFQDNKIGIKKSPCLRAGNSATYIIDDRKFVNKIKNVNSSAVYRKLTPLECERLQTLPDKVFYAIIDLKELLCLDQAKSFTSVVEKNHKLLKHVLSAEKKELREYVNNVLYQNLEKEEGSVVVNVPMNLIEGKITHNGKAESLLKGNNSPNQKNGSSVQKLFLKEIMELVEDVVLEIEKKTEKSSIYTTSYPLSTQSIEQILTILYCFAKSVTDGCIATKIQIENLYLSLTNGYTEGVSNSQRYKMIGNGWVVAIPTHILSFIPIEKEK